VELKRYGLRARGSGLEIFFFLAVDNHRGPVLYWGINFKTILINPFKQVFTIERSLAVILQNHLGYDVASFAASLNIQNFNSPSEQQIIRYYLFVQAQYVARNANRADGDVTGTSMAAGGAKKRK